MCVNFLGENNAKLFISNNKLSCVKIGPEKGTYPLILVVGGH